MIYQLDKLKEMAEGDTDFIEAVMATFVDEVPADLIKLQAAIQVVDYNSIYKLAHKMKPNLELLGLEKARVNALEIEKSGKGKEHLDEIKKRFAELLEEVTLVTRQIEKDFDF